MPRGSQWVDGVNESSADPEVERLRECIRRDQPFGSQNWMIATAQRLGLESSLRPRGRPYGPGPDQPSRGKLGVSSFSPVETRGNSVSVHFPRWKLGEGAETRCQFIFPGVKLGETRCQFIFPGVKLGVSSE